MPLTDAELVEAACGGDVASFQELFERHYPLAVGIARGRLGDVHLAEDVAQEAFQIACRRLAMLNDGRRFPEWLGTICRRVAGRMARSRRNEQPINGELVAEQPMPGENNRLKQLRSIVDRLPASAREVIVLRYFSGLSHEEIARALRLTPESVHGRLQRARRKIADELSHHPDY